MSDTVKHSLDKADGLPEATVIATDRKVTLTTSREPVKLFIEGAHRLNLMINYALSLSTDERFLAVQDSSFKVFPVVKDLVSGPLVTFDYLRHPASNHVPTAHLNLHTENDSLLYALAESGNTRRSKNRRKRASRKSTGNTALRSVHGSEGDVHIPLGGARFRPCIEDVLEMLIIEFGVEHAGQGWRQALAEGRKRWREHQLHAAVNDNPTVAAEKLQELGYSVEWPKSEHVPVPNASKLERF